MSGLYKEADYENSIIELFRNDLGYEYVYGPDIERDFYSPLYDDVLIDSLYRLNRDLPEDAMQDALFKLKNIENGELVQKNSVFMDYLQNGIPVRYLIDGEESSSIVYLVDYNNPDNNSFIIANQWTFIENSEKRPDIILFLNGLPIVLVELKSPSREETDASEAYRQLRNYMKEIPSMFVYNAICVMSDQLTTKAGTITSGEDRFMEWKSKDGSYEKVTLGIKGYDASTYAAYAQAQGQQVTTDEGVYVAEVVSGSAAEKAGIKSGDIIVKIGDTKLTSMSDLTKSLYTYKSGNSTKIVVNRDGKEETLNVTF